MYNICNGAIRWQMHYFLFDGNSNVCWISHHLQDIRKTKCQQSDIENEGHCQREERLAPFDWKCSILYRWIFEKFRYPAACVYAKGCYYRGYLEESQCSSVKYCLAMWEIITTHDVVNHRVYCIYRINQTIYSQRIISTRLSSIYMYMYQSVLGSYLYR